MFSTPVVIDTNVLVSALLIKGSIPDKIIQMVKDRTLQTRYCSAIIDEYRDVLLRPKFNFQVENVRAVIEGIMRIGLEVNPSSSNFAMVDEDDRIFYDVAVTSHSLLITGNGRHFPKESFVLSPADFLRISTLA
jgi:putative PIN family toxin of toxin-antitoxin system